jgi:hypothetical protein
MDNSLKCIICGSSLYNTDHCLNEDTYHCSSAEARFWDFERGSSDQQNAKEHWDKSKLEISNLKKNIVS